MLKVNVEVFYVLGKTLSGELFCMQTGLVQADSEDPDQMLHFVLSLQWLHYLHNTRALTLD